MMLDQALEQLKRVSDFYCSDGSQHSMNVDGKRVSGFFTCIKCKREIFPDNWRKTSSSSKRAVPVVATSTASFAGGYWRAI